MMKTTEVSQGAMIDDDTNGFHCGTKHCFRKSFLWAHWLTIYCNGFDGAGGQRLGCADLSAYSVQHLLKDCML